MGTGAHQKWYAAESHAQRSRRPAGLAQRLCRWLAWGSPESQAVRRNRSKLEVRKGSEEMSAVSVQDSIQAEIFIAAPPARVFQALVDPQQVLAWWGQTGVYRCTEFNNDLRVGGKWRSAGVAGQDDRFTVTGEYLQVDSPRVL